MSASIIKGFPVNQTGLDAGDVKRGALAKGPALQFKETGSFWRCAFLGKSGDRVCSYASEPDERRTRPRWWPWVAAQRAPKLAPVLTLEQSKFCPTVLL